MGSPPVRSVAVVVGLVSMWRSQMRYSLKATALATGTVLLSPYLSLYDMMVLAIPVALLIRIGLCDGFERYEIPGRGCAALLLVMFAIVDAPLGLGASLIIAILVARRAGRWWQRQAMPSWRPAARGASA